MKKVKVCHITTVHSPFDVRIFHKECRTLVRAGYEVYLIAQHDKEETVDGVNIIPLSKVSSRLKRILFLSIKALLEAIKLNSDIYHFHDPELIPTGIILKFLGKNVIYDIHEYYTEILLSSKNISVRNNIIKDILRFTLKFILEKVPKYTFDWLIFPTESLKREFDSPLKSSVLLNLPTIDEIEKHINPDSQERIFDIVFAGTVSPFRMKFMLEIAQKLCLLEVNYKWLFVGIPSETIKWVYKNYKKEFLERYIVMVGRIPYEVLLKYLEKSKIGFNYHPFEKRFNVAIPMKVFEYMLVGLPVVSTALPELNCYLRNNIHAILVNSQNPLEYANALYDLIRNPGKASEIARNGRELILNQLNWEMSESSKLLRIYNIF